MTQNETILRYMQEHNGISTYQAFKLNITRLAARISELRSAGHRITSEMVSYKADDGKKKTYCLYRLEDGQE